MRLGAGVTVGTGSDVAVGLTAAAGWVAIARTGGATACGGLGGVVGVSGAAWQAASKSRNNPAQALRVIRRWSICLLLLITFTLKPEPISA